jgi:hypothetical protein
MRIEVDVIIKRDAGKDEFGRGVVYYDELPRNITRGRNKAGKRRQGKRALELARRPPEDSRKSRGKYGRPDSAAVGP